MVPRKSLTGSLAGYSNFNYFGDTFIWENKVLSQFLFPSDCSCSFPPLTFNILSDTPIVAQVI